MTYREMRLDSAGAGTTAAPENDVNLKRKACWLVFLTRLMAVRMAAMTNPHSDRPRGAETAWSLVHFHQEGWSRLFASEGLP